MYVDDDKDDLEVEFRDEVVAFMRVIKITSSATKAKQVTNMRWQVYIRSLNFRAQMYTNDLDDPIFTIPLNSKWLVPWNL